MRSDDGRDVVQKYLDDDERLEWVGRPVQGIRFRGVDAFLVPFSLAWVSIPAFIVYKLVTDSSGNQDPDGPVITLMAIAFLVIGLYLFAGRFVVNAVQRSGTTYGVTNRRILIVSEGRNKNVQSIEIESLKQMRFTESSGGLGSIDFGLASKGGGLAKSGWPGFSKARQPCFDRIEDGRRVYNLIRERALQ